MAAAAVLWGLTLLGHARHAGGALGDIRICLKLKDKQFTPDENKLTKNIRPTDILQIYTSI